MKRWIVVSGIWCSLCTWSTHIPSEEGLLQLLRCRKAVSALTQISPTQETPQVACQGHPLEIPSPPPHFLACPTGPMGEELQMPDKDAKAMMGTEDTWECSQPKSSHGQVCSTASRYSLDLAGEGSSEPDRAGYATYRLLNAKQGAAFP